MRKINWFFLLFSLSLIIAGCSETQKEPPQKSGTDPLLYQNEQYGFMFTLPVGWEKYTVVTDEWEGTAICGPQSEEIIENGPKILIRHPLWTEENPRQDIPIMIFTLEQWKYLTLEFYSVGAAPIAPTELGRNGEYVFALPARYNYGFPEGYEEVEELLQNSPLEPTDPK